MNEQVISFFNGFRRDAHPMAIMCGVVGALSSFYHQDMNVSSEKTASTQPLDSLQKVPTIAAMSQVFCWTPLYLP